MEYLLYELLWLFLLYSFFGWCLEVITAAVKEKHFVNRGFLNAPFCPIYGSATVLFELFLPELKGNLFFLFLGGLILASFLEYWSGRILERFFGRKWWDYSDQKYNLDGYVCLKYSLVWGVLAVLTTRWISPFLMGLTGLIPTLIGKIILWVVYIVLILDMAGTLAALLQLHHGLVRIRQLNRDLQHFSQTIGNALTRRIHRRMMHAFPNINRKELTGFFREETDQPVFAQGCGFYKLFSLFMIGAFLGDLIETVYCYATAGVIMSRSSVVYGRFSIVWGLGCVLLTAILYRYKNSNDRHIFLAGTVLGGAYEYICSVFTELVFGTVFWDYSEIPFNLGGRINLLYCFFWGIVAVLWLKILYPFLSERIERIPVKTGVILVRVLLVFMIWNVGVSGLALARYTARQNHAAADNAVESYLDRAFPDERIERIYPNLIIVD